MIVRVNDDFDPILRIQMPVRSLILCLSLFLVSSVSADETLDGLQIGSGTDLNIVMLHGDEGNGGDPLAYAAFGTEIARRLPMATVHMLLRPGYSDPWGRQSPGENYGRRDQYTLESAALIADTLERIKQDKPLLAIGHSGGAAQLALALSLKDEIADEAILVGCPCDLDLWKSLNPNWPSDTLVRSVSATSVGAPQLDHIVVLVGESDNITPPSSSASYSQHLRDSGVSNDLKVIAGGDHAGNRALSKAWLSAILTASQRLLNP